MLELPKVSVMNILGFVPSKEVLFSVQFVSKHWYEAANDPYAWREVRIKTLENRGVNGFLWSHGKHLKSLTLEKIRLSRKATYNIHHKCKNLLDLNLKKVYSCSMLDDRFCFIISKLKKLTSLQLPAHTKITTSGLNLLSNLNNLELFDLKRNNIIDNFNSLRRLKKLKNLDLSGCVHIDNAFCAAISTLKLRRLVLSYCFSITLQGVRSFFSTKHPELGHLVMNGVNYTPDIIELVASNAEHLHSLSLSSLSIDHEVYKSLKCLKHLDNLTIIGCSKIKDFRVFKQLPLRHMCICRTSFDVFERQGLVKFAKENKHIKFYLFDNYAIGHRQQLFKEVKLLDNIVLHYS